MKTIIAVAFAVLLVLAPQARAQTAVVFGWGPFPDVPAIAEAQQNDLWKAQNLAVKIIPFATGRDAFEALIGGQLDFAIMAEFPAVTGTMRNLKFAIPAVLAEYKSFRLIVKSDTPITGLAQLAGKKIAMPLGTNVHFIIADALKAQGVKAELVNVAPPDMGPALVRGDVDAAATFPSAYPGLKKTLGAKYQEIKLAGYSSSFILVASEKAAADPALVQRVLAALVQGDALVFKDETAAQAVTAAYVNKAVSPEAIAAAWPDYDHHVRLDQETLDLMVREGTWLRAEGFVKQGTPSVELFRKMFMPGPLKALSPDSVTIH
jgi:NitT/TauT family transport system substrate-binding protein